MPPPQGVYKQMELASDRTSTVSTLWRTSDLPKSQRLKREQTVQRLPHLAGPTLAAVCHNISSMEDIDTDEYPGSKASSPVDPPKSQIDFQFLNFSHPSDAKGSRARRTVRSHVTRQQHQKEHAAAAARRAKTFPQLDAEPDELPQSSSHVTTHQLERAMTLELPRRSQTIASSAETSTSSPSPSPTRSPLYRPEGHIDPSDVYPEEWHPFLPRIMVGMRHRESEPLSND